MANNEMHLEWHGNEVEELIMRQAELALIKVGEHMVKELKSPSHGKYPLKTSGSNEYARSMGYKFTKKGKSPEIAIGSSLERAIFYEYGTGIKAEKGGGRRSPWSFQDSNGKWWHNFKGGRASWHITYSFRDEKSKCRQILERGLAIGRN